MIICAVTLIFAWLSTIDSIQHLVITYVTSNRHGKRFIFESENSLHKAFCSGDEVCPKVWRLIFWSIVAVLNTIPFVSDGTDYLTYDNPLMFWFDIAGLSAIVITVILRSLRSWYNRRCEAEEEAQE